MQVVPMSRRYEPALARAQTASLAAVTAAWRSASRSGCWRKPGPNAPIMASTATLLASAPASWPPIPSATANTAGWGTTRPGTSPDAMAMAGSTPKASWFSRRTAPTSVRAPAASRRAWAATAEAVGGRGVGSTEPKVGG